MHNTGRVCWFNVWMNHQDLVSINIHIVRHLESSCAPGGHVSNTDCVSPHYSGWCRPHRKINGDFSLYSDFFAFLKVFTSRSSYWVLNKQVQGPVLGWLLFPGGVPVLLPFLPFASLALDW